MMSKQNTLGCLVALIASLIMVAGSFIGTDAEVYFFPRLIGVVMLALAVIMILIAVSEGLDSGPDVSMDWRALLPGLLVLLALFLLAETVGFYASAGFAFLAIITLYGKRAITDWRAFTFKLPVMVVFVAIIYFLFWRLLYVFTPTGLLF